MLKYRQIGGPNPTYISGTKVGQLMIVPYPIVELIETSELSITDRGHGGFGSTGS